jgi:hypothetical protein
MKIDEKLGEAAVLGGAFLGGGGGGCIEDGLRNVKLACEIGKINLLQADEVPGDSSIITVSMVGAPAAKKRYVTPRHLVRSVELLIEQRIKVGGIISSENGGCSTTSGWIQAATFGLPVIDAPADGRAHPTSLMGSMGLHLTNYVSLQTAAGGKGKRYLEVAARGGLEEVSGLMREASVRAGGLVAVARNPVPPNHVKRNAAVGGISEAIELGKIFQKYKQYKQYKLKDLLSHLVEKTKGRVIDQGTVEHFSLETRGGFDRGKVILKGAQRYSLTFLNEYLSLETLESEGKRLATFPDLIVTLDGEEFLPLTSAELEEGQQVALLVVPKNELLLGSGVKDPGVLAQINEIMGEEIVEEKC